MGFGLGKLAAATTGVALLVIGPGVSVRSDGAEENAREIPRHLRGLRKISPRRGLLDPRMTALCIGPIDRAQPQPAGPHKKGAVLVYANDEALDYRRANPKGHEYPAGSIFLKEKYSDLEAAEPHLATVMKRTGSGGGIEDWKFSVISLPVGEQPDLGRKAAACIDCHSGFESNGFVSRHTERQILAFLEKPTGPPAAGRSNVDSKGFLALGAEAEKLRDRRLLPAEDFARLAKRGDTVVLDARSRADFARRHIDGAVNLPYTEFNPDALARIIPSKETAVLIYCSNNLGYPVRRATTVNLTVGNVKISGERRLLRADDLARLAKRLDTLAPDAGSRAASVRQQINGAVDLPNTELDPDAPGEIGPPEDIAAMIYGDNTITFPETKTKLKPRTKPATGDPLGGGETFIGGGFKGRTAALNIPTFITLYGYGYRNLYELGPSVIPGESVIEFSTTGGP